MKPYARREDGALLMVDDGPEVNPNAQIVSPDGTWSTTIQAALARGEWSLMDEDDQMPPGESLATRSRDGSGVTRVVFHLPGKHPQKNHAGEGNPLDLIPGDKLKLAGRIPLGEGETLVGSDVFAPRGSGLVPMALVGTPEGPRLRIGTGILDEDKDKWAGRNLGQTANLDASGIRQLRDALNVMQAEGAEAGRRFRGLEDREDELDQMRRDIVKRQYRGLSKADAKRLDRLDRRIELLDGEIDHAQASLRRSADWLAENDPAGRARWDEIDVELAALDPTSEEDDERVRQLQMEQARLVPSRPFKRMRNIIDMQEERKDLNAERQKLTADGTPLTSQDQAELSAVEADIADIQRQHDDMAEATLFEGDIAGEWADIAWQVSVADTAQGSNSLGISYRLSARPKDAGEEWEFAEENGEVSLEPKELAKLGAVIDGLMSQFSENGGPADINA